MTTETFELTVTVPVNIVAEFAKKGGYKVPDTTKLAEFCKTNADFQRKFADILLDAHMLFEDSSGGEWERACIEGGLFDWVVVDSN